MSFKPILAPNEQVDLTTLKYPLLASYKLDGIRGIFREETLVSRSLKPIPSRQIQERFNEVAYYSAVKDMILDGEFYSPRLTFQEITSFVMTEDLTSSKTVKKNGGAVELPEHLKFYVFDCLSDPDESFQYRIQEAKRVCGEFPDILEFVEQFVCNNAQEVEKLFEKALAFGVEGLILRDPNGRYKYGRGTVKEGIIYKVKPFETFDANILGVVQSTEVDASAEKTITELGYSKTSQKKGDRVLIEKAAAFSVDYQGKILKVSLAMTDEEKVEVWKKRDSFLGTWIEFKAMKVGMKDLPRHPVFLRYVDPSAK